MFTSEGDPSHRLQGGSCLYTHCRGAYRCCVLLYDAIASDPPCQGKGGGQFKYHVLPEERPIAIMCHLFQSSQYRRVKDGLYFYAQCNTGCKRSMRTGDFQLFLQLSNNDAHIASVVLPTWSSGCLRLSQRAGQAAGLPCEFFLFLAIPCIECDYRGMSNLPRSSCLYVQ